MAELGTNRLSGYAAVSSSLRDLELLSLGNNPLGFDLDSLTELPYLHTLLVSVKVHISCNCDLC